jgi:alpha-D-xyloside xylohydrolase
LYEDENDNYNYEKGIFSTISFFWNDAKRQLTIGKRQGIYPGMPVERTFQIVIVKKDNRNGVELAGTPDRTLPYQGSEKVIQF